MNSNAFANRFAIFIILIQLLGILILYYSWKMNKLSYGVILTFVIYVISLYLVSKVKVYDDKGKVKKMLDTVISISILFLLSLAFYLLVGTIVLYKLENGNRTVAMIPLLNSVLLICSLGIFKF